MSCFALLSVFACLYLCLLCLGDVSGGKPESTRSHSVSPPRNPTATVGGTCPSCSAVIFSTNQCPISTTLESNGQCSVSLNRCTAEYLNTHHGGNIDMSRWERKTSDYLAIGFNPGTKQFELVKNGHAHVESVESEDDEVAFTKSVDDSLNEDSLNEVQSKSNLADIDTSAMQRTFHAHDIKCRHCGDDWTCARDDDCQQTWPGAYCYRPRRDLGGICKINLPTRCTGGAIKCKSVRCVH